MLRKHNGDTPLHVEIRNYTSLAELKKFIGEQNPKLIAKMTRTVNDAGLSPIQMLHEYNFDKQSIDEIYEVLSQIIKSKRSKKITEPVKIDKIVQRYNIDIATSLYNNLKIACEIANDVRQLLTEAFTHLQTNNYDDTTKEKLNNEITIERQICAQSQSLLKPVIY